jgi:hypothetical protein
MADVCAMVSRRRIVRFSNCAFRLTRCYPISRLVELAPDCSFSSDENSLRKFSGCFKPKHLKRTEFSVAHERITIYAPNSNSFCSLLPCTTNMILPQAMILSRYRPPSSQHSQDRLGIRRKRLKRQLKKRGAYDDVVVIKGAQLTMSSSPVTAEAEKRKREDDQARLRARGSGSSVCTICSSCDRGVYVGYRYMVSIESCGMRK